MKEKLSQVRKLSNDLLIKYHRNIYWYLFNKESSGFAEMPRISFYQQTNRPFVSFQDNIDCMYCNKNEYKKKPFYYYPKCGSGNFISVFQIYNNELFATFQCNNCIIKHDKEKYIYFWHISGMMGKDFEFNIDNYLKELQDEKFELRFRNILRKHAIEKIYTKK